MAKVKKKGVTAQWLNGMNSLQSVKRSFAHKPLCRYFLSVH
jgi:hypothetical protein